jgi:hypothetical protein
MSDPMHDTGDSVRDAYLVSVADLTTAWSRRGDDGRDLTSREEFAGHP